MHLCTSCLWRNADFLKLWAAQTISFVGSQITLLALPLTAALTLQASPTQMGMLRTVDLAPALLVGLIAGAFIDRVRRRPVLIIADIGRAVLLASVPVVSYLGFLSISYLYVVALLGGILTVFFDVAHLSLLPTLVPRARLVEGNSKLEVSRSVAMIAGPGIAGLLVQLLTASIALLIDAVSYIGSALFLLLLRTPESSPARPAERTRFWADVMEGFHVVGRHPLLRTMAVSLCVFNFFYSMIGTVYILYVVRDLQFTPATLGLVYTLGSIGFPVGASFAGRAAQRFGIGPTIVWGAGISDAAFLLIPVAHAQQQGAVVLLIAAQLLATLAGPMTAINQLSLRQAITPDRLQGRVNGTMRVIALGAAPVGALLAGMIGQTLGLRPTLVVGALGLQLGFFVLLFSPVRQVHDQPHLSLDEQTT